MKNISKVAGFVAAAAMLTMSLTAVAAQPSPANANGNKLQCFDGRPTYPGMCSLTPSGVATLDNTAGPYSGVYIQNSNLDGKLLSNVNQLAFNYTGTPTNGSPRLTFPLDVNGDGVTDDYISISAFWCNNGAGLVDAINDPTCTIFRNSDGVNPVAANWSDMVAAHPTWRVGKDLPFIIADDTGYWTVSNVQLGKGPAKGAK